MRSQLSALLGLGLALLFATSAQAVTLGDFSCTGSSSSRLCGWGEDSLSADLQQQRDGRARLNIALSGSGVAEIRDVAIHAGDLEILEVHRIDAGHFQIRYRGDFEDLLAGISVGVDMGMHRHRASFLTAAIPEPASAALFALGAMIVGHGVRRR